MPGVRTEVRKDDSKGVPHSIEAEKYVLGCALLDNREIEIVNEMLEVSDFFSEINRGIYLAMRSFTDAGSPVDLVLLCQHLSAHGLLEKYGGAGYINSLSDGVPMGVEATLREHCRRIKAQSQHRQILHVCMDAQAKALQAIDTPEALGEDITSSITNILNSSKDRKLVAVAEILDKTPGITERLMSPHQVKDRIPTGFRDLDALIGGLGPGELTVLAARPSRGKTALALSIAINAARKKDLPTAFFSLEMNRENIVSRAMTSEGRIDSQEVRAGMLTKEEIGRSLEVLTMLWALPLWVDDTSSISVPAVRGRAKRLQITHGLGLIVIDYLQLMGSTQRFEKRVDLVTHISQGLKSIAKDLNVPILALSQLSRAPEGRVRRRPQLSDLRDSGAIEQDADTVMFLWVDKNRGENPPTTLIIGKQRNGPTGDVPLTFLKEYTKFVDCEPRRDED